LAFSPDGRYLIVGASDLLGRTGAVVALRVDDGATVPLDDSAPKDLAIVGDRVVWIDTAGGLVSLSLANVASAQPDPVLTFDAPLSHVAATGRTGEIAIASDDQVGLLDLDAPAPRPRWLGSHRTWVSGLTASPDGRVLVSTDGGGELLFWDLAEGRELSTPILLGTGNGLDAVFSPRPGSADLLLVSSAGLQVIDGDPASWADRACRIANRDLTKAEWDRFVGAERPYARLCSNRTAGGG
jgi:WD40 repeat protein